MTEAMLQYFHAWYNKELFNNELEPVIICANNTEEFKNIQAQFINNFDPYTIAFNIDVPEEEETESDTLYYLTVLLHEMVHQYCEENDIQDTLYGKHLQAFIEEAENKGLVQNGYCLNDEIKERVIKQIKLYKQLHEVTINYANRPES